MSTICGQPHVYDQLFIDGTYFNKNCLLVVSTKTHVVAWRWCSTEDSWDYSRLLEQLPAPRVVTTNGQQGALKAIKKTWRHTQLQRCIVHVKRNVQNHVTLHPRTPAGKALRRLSLDLLTVTTAEHAAKTHISLLNPSPARGFSERLTCWTFCEDDSVYWV